MQASKIKDVITILESWAPRSYQESYDNSGLLVGNPDTPVTAALVSLDCTEQVVEEASSLGCNLIVSHHPIIFKGIKSLTGKSYVERTVMSAIRKDIALLAAHTNLDNVHSGVNRAIADKLELKDARILSPRRDTLSKLVTFAPEKHVQPVLAALHKAGAGQIGHYKDCSFRVMGTGSFRPDQLAKPSIGVAGQMEEVLESRIEVIFDTHATREILTALRSAHPYEEVAYYLTRVDNENQDVGAGMIGELATPEEPIAFLKRLKRVMNVKVVRHTPLIGRSIKKVALCGGSGSFLIPEALRHQADVFISADLKYHEFFDAEGKIVLADIGHYESEQFTKDLILAVLRENFTTFASHFSKTVTNPISYL